jgi:polysaccharide export outer membrane protein
MTHVRRMAWIAIALVASTAIGHAADDIAYRISPGDTVQIKIATLPDGINQAIVQLDGTVALPQIGMVPVAGLTLAELQARMKMVVPTTVFRIRTADGREQALLLKPEDVTTAIVDYRPIYIKGDVLTPGQQPYRPLMTIRQAVAVAGGYSAVRSRAGLLAPDPVDLQNVHDALRIDYVHDVFRKRRAEAELQDKPGFDRSAPAGSPLSGAMVAAIAQGEMDAMNTVRDDIERQRLYLEEALRGVGDQIDVLIERERAEEAAVKADEEDLERVRTLFETGNLTSNRMADLRRALMMSSSRRLETTVELMHARYRQADFVRQLERAVSQRRIGLLKELTEANVRLAALEVKLRAAREKLRSAGVSAPIAGVTPRAKITIIRKVGDAWLSLDVEEDAEVLPGDVIETVYDSSPETYAAMR